VEGGKGKGIEGRLWEEDFFGGYSLRSGVVPYVTQSEEEREAKKRAEKGISEAYKRWGH